MASVDKLNNQHSELKKIIANLSDLLHPDIIKSNSIELASMLTKFSSKMNLHLALEDKILYPNLISHSDRKISQKAKIFMKEMGNIKKKFGIYINRWRFSSNINSIPMDFINESHSIFEVLSKRIKREDEDLFPLLA